MHLVQLDTNVGHTVLLPRMLIGADGDTEGLLTFGTASTVW